MAEQSDIRKCNDGLTGTVRGPVQILPEVGSLRGKVFRIFPQTTGVKDSDIV